MRRPKAVRTADGFKYFDEEQVRFFRHVARGRAQLAAERGQVIGIRISMVADLLTSTGMRESEAADLRPIGGSGLQNLGNGNYQYNWATPKSYANSCKTLRLDLGEGTGQEHTAQFKFSK